MLLVFCRAYQSYYYSQIKNLPIKKPLLFFMEALISFYIPRFYFINLLTRFISLN